jgi:hypothetical protein
MKKNIPTTHSLGIVKTAIGYLAISSFFLVAVSGLGVAYAVALLKKTKKQA